MRRLLFPLFALGLCAAASAASPALQDFQEAIGKTADPLRGERLFVTCAGCHGQDGRGNADGSVPLIAGQHERVLARQLADYRHARRWNPSMQNFADNHVLADTQAIADVAAYVAGLARGRARGTGRGDLVQLGRSTYAQRCASCHGSAAEGDGQTGVPRIASQHYAYLLRLFHEAVEGRRPNFPADHLRLLEQLEPDQLLGLADAISRTQ